MRVFSRAAIRQFSGIHADAREPLDRWYRIAKHANWSNPAEVKSDFGTVDFVGDFAVFNIGGNKYRLIAAIKYRWRTLYIREILTHADYGKGEWRTK